MSSSTQRRLVFISLLVLGVVAAWFFFRRRAASDRATPAAAQPPAATTLPSAVVSSSAPAAASNAPGATGAPSVDYGKALNEARRLPDVSRRTREFGRLLALWLAEDPSAALAYVRQLRAGAEFTQGLLLTLEVIGAHDLDRALALARELAVTREQRAIYSSLFAQLARQDVQAAAQRLPLVPPGEARENAVRALADEWARHDFAAALAWSRQLDLADRAAGTESVIAALVPDDPLQAIQLAQQLLDGPALNRTLTVALEKLTSIDPMAAAGIVGGLPAGETQTFAALDVGRALAARDPAKALAWIETLPVGETQRLVLDNALESWAANDSTAAGAYVRQMAAGAGQDAAAGHFARFVGAREPQRAIAWAQSLASESARETALVAIGSAWAQHAPAEATQWAATLPAGAVQTGAVSGAFSYWLQRDGAAAQTWLATANLSAEMKVHLSPTHSP